MNHSDRIRLRHMLDAIDAARGFVAGRKRDDLDEDTMLVFALTRAIEIIGEAASRVSRETQEAFPEIPWAQMTGMRNRIVHAYFDINRDILWSTARVSLPELAEQLEKLLPPEK